jgi:hypothetical protein
MEVGFKIPIHEESQEYLQRVFNDYEEVDRLFELNDPIIHIYPKQDTYNENGELNGYIDSLFAEYHFYDTVSKTVYKSKRLHDGLWFGRDVNPRYIRIFKDGSTLLAFKGRYEFDLGQSVWINLV